MRKTAYYILLFLTFIAMFQESKNNVEIINLLIRYVKEFSPLGMFILLIMFNNERNSNQAYIKHLKKSLEFTEGNMHYFKKENIRLMNEKKEKEANKEN